jgi:hypothetical protein
MVSKKLQPNLLHVELYISSPKFNQATDWPHSTDFFFNSESKNWAETPAGMERQIFFFLGVPCVSASHLPAFPVSLPQI